MEESQIIEEIKNKLNEIEEKENVTILFAVESGSRAWALPRRIRISMSDSSIRETA